MTMSNKRFAHLHVHNEFSQLDGLGNADSYIRKAKLLGFRYLGLTNHGNIDGLIKFQKAALKEGIKPILGCEAYIVPKLEAEDEKKSRRMGHILLLIKNQQGFENICTLLSYANLEGFYYKPRITYKMLLKHCKGLVVSTACPQTFLSLDGGEQFFKFLKRRIKEDIYCEVMPHNSKIQRITNDLQLEVAERFGVKVIGTNDVHYVGICDFVAQEVLLAIQRKAKWGDANRFKFDIKGLHLRSAKEMRRAFEKQGKFKREWLTNTIEIARKCSGFRIKEQDINLPRVQEVKGKEHSFLYDLCNEKLGQMGLDEQTYSDYKWRFTNEYQLITKKKFERYFLIVWELINWCKANRILVGPGRGSVGGSLIAYLMGITAVDPMYHNLIFDRFINEDRIDYPDIDIDFEHTKRHLVKEHLEKLYGENHIAGVSSFNRMKARAVIRDVSRVFGVPYGEVDRFAKLIEDVDEGSAIDEVVNTYSEGQDFKRDYPQVVKLAKKLEGQVRGYSQHAAALIVSNEPIDTCGRCNLLERDGITLINWEKEDTEYVGLMKLDALGLKLLSILGECKRLIYENHKKNIKLETLNLEDKKVLKEIDQGNTVGMFQLNTWAMTNLIKEMGISKFDHIVAATALVRPGPFNSGMTAEYIRRKHGESWHGEDEYVEITKDTYGLLVYQEQVMDVIYKIAGLPYSTADKIRKIIGKKRDVHEFEKYRRKFIRGCKKKGIFDEREAVQFWEGLQEWAKYGFNKAHSVGYAMLGYWCAWLKKYFPTEFICASLTYCAKDKKAQVVEEAYRLGLTLVLPKVGISNPDLWLAKGNKLYVPFIEVRGIGAVKAIQAAEEPKGAASDWFNEDELEGEPMVWHKGKFGELLNSIGAYNPADNVDINEEIKALFDFRIVTNPRENYAKLYELFDDNIRLTDLDAVLNGSYKLLKRLSQRRTLVRTPRFKGHRKLHLCKKCELRNECQLPVQPSLGQYNIMIVGEAPGYDEDKDGEGFVGASGRLVWKYLNTRKYYREMFHITNVNKCYPSVSKKPNNEQIKACSPFINREIRRAKPILILAFGNTSLNYFTGKKSGIIAMSGRTLWHEEIGAFVAYSVHPAAMLHNPDNEQYYKAGMKNFTRLLSAIAPNIKGRRK